MDNPLSFWRRGANAAKKPTNAFFHPGVVISNTLTTVWIAYLGSVVKCARSQVRPFHNDDEAAHEHVSEHMRDLGERLLHEGDFSYEDITGQDEPPVDSPPAPRENTATGPGCEGQMDVDPEARRRMRGKTRPSDLNSQQAHRSTQALMHHQARARWPDRAMDTRWARTWKPDESKPSGRRAKARLIMKGFTEPNFP